MEIWMCPNLGSKDMQRLFADPDAWSRARELVSVYQIYVQLITGGSECGPNQYPALAEWGAFTKLREWGKKLAIEAGSVKPGDCDASRNTENIIRAINMIREVGGDVDYISIDEDLPSGKQNCAQDPETTARYTSAYMANVTDTTAVAVGLIEPYPLCSADEIISHVDRVSNLGRPPAHLHLDVDWWEIRNRKTKEATVTRDLTSIREKTKAHGMPLGLIVWAHGTTGAEFLKDTTDVIDHFSRVAPRDTDRVIVQSWQSRESEGTTIYDSPDNLPETSDTTLTRAVLHALNWDKNRPVPPGTAPTGTATPRPPGTPPRRDRSGR